MSSSERRVAIRDWRVRSCFWSSAMTGSGRSWALVGVGVGAGFLLRVWAVGVGIVEVGVFKFPSPSGLMCRVSFGTFPASTLPPSSCCLVGASVLSSDACAGRRRGDLNGLESFEDAFSIRRRFPVRSAKVILDILQLSVESLQSRSLGMHEIEEEMDQAEERMTSDTKKHYR